MNDMVSIRKMRPWAEVGVAEGAATVSGSVDFLRGGKWLVYQPEHSQWHRRRHLEEHVLSEAEGWLL